jgi:hypothetical protein
MKVKEYEQMMRYLTSTGEFKRNNNKKGNYIVETAKKFDNETKPKVRQETMPERIDRVLYEEDGIGERPKHLDNKNIKSFEDMGTVNKPFKKIKKISRPINIDISGINTDLNKLENIMNKTPEPVYKPPAEEEKLEGIETILQLKIK